jgi:hypothetical protein
MPYFFQLNTDPGPYAHSLFIATLAILTVFASILPAIVPIHCRQIVWMQLELWKTLFKLP